MRVGVGIISYNRPKHLELCIKQLAENTPDDVVYHVANDSKERKGVAFRSNECLKDLYDSGCDYFFLFNDDCFPIKAGWDKHFIDASKASGNHHFMYLHPTHGVKMIDDVHLCPFSEFDSGSLMSTPIEVYDNCNGCMMFMTREVIEKVGGFSPNFKLYGFEHANYSDRIHRAGLTPMGRYLCPAGAQEYIYALDIDNHLPFNKQLKHKGSMSAKEALFHAGKGREVYNTDHTLFYPL